MGLEWLGAKTPMPEVAGKYSGDCIVVCTAKCVWDDLNKVPNDADIMCVNDIGLRFPGKIEHWYSSHADALKHYVTARHAGRYKAVSRFGPDLTHTIAASPRPGDADVIWPWPGHGNSGLNAIYTALALGYGQVWVCGLPMDNSGHFNDGPPGHWLEPLAEHGKWSEYGDRKHYKVWERAIANVFDDRVTFMSGRFA